ncbi:MAG: hypothetical protein M3342_23380 [Bacteroidota bacterium]|nr:hypothetical protein [Flavisolibacter sp.]MBD0297495.1 hypothetical protein [Flavisolibacter sp.]MBD0366916.1 hypothetical protein [Flavisolibacter sp.]MBD0376507.1 hypothetical protein [Flavisolibacter sp.]MDQ3846928.1 hypothetical protein [Bacteroidota bacterium]
MLDPKDVRVGNWVIKIIGTDNNNQSFFAYKPIAIDEYYYTFAKVCFPIKLSSDILGKCGFKHEFGDWYINLESEGIDDGLPFLRYKHKVGCWYLWDKQLPVQPKYLHQLQNLYYALSNQELTIRLGFFENINIIGPINFFIKPLIKSSPINKLL